MKSVYRLAAASAVVVSVSATLASGVNAAEKVRAPLQTLIAGPAGPVTFVKPDAVTLQRGTRAVTIHVTYHGFPTAARASFQRAVNIWAKTLTSSVPVTVDATFTKLGNPNILGQAGPGFFWRNFPGAPRSNTWFADAVANKNHGSQLDPTSPDIVARFNSTFPNWHFGKGPAPAKEYDFESVVLHELGHGVGFLGAGDVSGGQGTVRFGSPANPTIYDLFTEDKSGKKLTSYADPSTALGNALVSNNIFYNSKRVRNAFGKRAKLFAPNPFQPGSSYSHLDEATFPAGDPNSLMTPQLRQGETIRSVGVIVKAVLKDEGWN
jgi:hypothetical protein